MCILLKLHYAKFDVSRLLYSKVIEEKPLGGGRLEPPPRLVKEGLKELSDKFKLIDVHHRLYPNEKFAAHDSLEDVKALKRVFLHPLCSRELYNEVISNSRQLSLIRRKASFDKSTKISEQKISNFLKLNHPAKKLAKLGFT